MTATGKEALTLKQLRSAFSGGGSNGMRLANIEITVQENPGYVCMNVDSRNFVLFSSWAGGLSFTEGPLYTSIAKIFIPDQDNWDDVTIQTYFPIWGTSYNGYQLVDGALYATVDTPNYLESGKVRIDMLYAEPVLDIEPENVLDVLYMLNAYAIAFD